MGSVVGERFKRAVDYCIENRAALVCFSSSGGARMQEALYSLLQMAKTSAALARLAREHLPFISVLTDPTTGGVSASLAMLGDLNIAEPRALIGFAGPRVIEQTVIVPPGVAEAVLQRALAYGAVPKSQCASSVTSILRGVPGFESIKWSMFPKAVMTSFGKLPGVTTRVITDDDDDNNHGVLLVQHDGTPLE